MSKHRSRVAKNKKKDIPLSDRFGLVYARVSSKRQEIEGTGLQSQETRCIRGLEADKIPYEKSFLDSFSGGGDFMNRPAMRALIDYIDNNPHKNFVVIFDDLSRFARDTEFHLKLRAIFLARNVILKCLNYNFDDSEEGQFVETVFAAKNELDRKQNRRQVIQKQKARLENGYRAFHALKGYTRVKDALHGKIDVQNADAIYVKEALEGYASLRFVHKIDGARFLQEKGVISKGQSADKAITTFDAMLREVFFAGYIEYEPWGVARRIGHHVPVISLEVFEKNQRRLSKSSTGFVRQDVREDFELRGLVNCAFCLTTKLTGAPTSNGKGNKQNYYKCPNKNCSMYGKSIRADVMHEQFNDLLKEIAPCSEVIEMAKAVMEDVWTTELNNRGKIKLSVISRKNEIEKEIEILASRISNASSGVLVRQYERLLEKLAVELEELEFELMSEYDYKIPNRTAVDEVLAALKSPYSVWCNYDVHQKQRFFSFIFESNLVYNKFEGYRTPNYSLPIRVFEEINTSKPVQVEMARIELASEYGCAL